ncbi:MAG: virulence factor [Alphaproteobacteria bacterium]|nr:virulence factor [Alphaproteobacteria bacterium]
MFAIAFDLVVQETQRLHPRGVSQAYTDVGAALQRYGFRRIQGSVYVCESEDLANLFAAMQALQTLQWFSGSVRDIRAFRIEQWSDFTSFFKMTSH